MTLNQKEKKMEMSFDAKYASCINNLRNIGKPDFPEHQINLYADYIEIIVLFSHDDGISEGDVNDLFFGEPDEESDAARKDKQEAFIKRIFDLIDERIASFAGLYPFVKKDGVLYLKQDISNDSKYYITLLISSQLDVFKSFQPDLTTDFETLSYESLRKYLPSGEVRQFGKNTTYKGNAREKIRSLSKEIDIPINEYEVSQIDERNNQERGLDVIGWLPFKDNCQNKIVFLGQCACGKKFESKQHDTRRFEEYFYFYKARPQHTLFIPYSLINVSAGKFYHDFIERDYLVFERKRMVTLLSGNHVFDRLISRNLIERCIHSTHEHV